MMLRILASILLLFSILFMPFWVSVILAIAGMFYFHIFFEAVVAFLLVDLLYRVRGADDMVIFLSCAVFGIVLLVVELLKKKLKFYR